MKFVKRNESGGCWQFGLFVFLGTLCGAFPVLGQADSKKPTVSLDEIVVTADKSETNILKTPSGVSVLYGEDMKASGARVVADSLHMVPGLQLEDVEGNGTQTMMTMRGMPHKNSQYILVLVDGIPQSVATSEVYWASIPMEIVERIEVVRGPGSSLYGMNAMGGVINIITKKPASDFEASVQGSFGSYGENQQVIGFSGTKGKTGYLLSGKRSASDGWREKNNETLAHHLFGKIIHKFNEGASISFNLNFSDWDNDWPDFIPAEQYHAGVRKKVFYDTNETAQKTDLSSIFNYSINKSLQLSNRLYGQFMDKEWKNIVNVIDDDVDFFGVGDEIQAEWNRDLLGRTNKLVFGLQWEYKDGAYTQKFSQLFPREPLRGKKMLDTESSTNTFSGYIHDVLQLNDKLSLSAGLRYDFVDIESENNMENKGSHSADYDNISPKIGISYAVTDNVSVFASVGTGFKSPGTTAITKNPDIEPEKLLSYEAGVKAFLLKRVSLQAVLYTSELTDQITSIQDPNTLEGYGIVNAGESEMKGIELEAQWFILDNLIFFGTYTHNKSTYSQFWDKNYGDLSGKELTCQPRNKVTGGVRYFHDSGLAASFTTKWVDEQYMSPVNEEQLDSYIVSDAKISYKWENGFMLSAVARNVFDEEYAAYGENWGGGDIYYTPASPRSFLTELSYTF